ncbi:glycosyltransferase family 4 protein [Candidatus Kuenenbacteria bacterium]|nr:glycosyltransferase family 4 protein [Candidatus Kuenenbacteria bacterium]
MSKILIIHDRFMFRGGAERLVLIMAKGLGADICTGFWSDSECYPKSEVPHKLFVLGNSSQKSGWRYLKFQWLFYFKTKFIRDYDLVIFSGNNCLSAAHNVRAGVKKIFYCHTPVRHAYDLRDYYLKNKIWWKRIILRCFIPLSRLVYRYGFRQMDIVIANSKNVQNRIKKYLHRDSTVVWCPIQTDKFQWLSPGGYYLSFGRVDKLKRIGDVVRAFQKMPDKKLVVVSAGDDFENVKKLAAGYDNIQVLGWVDDRKLAELIGHCLASIYIPINEDAGMTPLESMSAGKPCIGVFDGGLKETIIDGKTGKFIPADYTIDDIIRAVGWLTSETAQKMRADCEAQAQKFSEEKFIEKMLQITKQ